ncbi:hypothetical protein VKT23_000623 [Stygiomarasmius scandens]|uniref:Uncharacterized protein n=1 Tax=Marasmiellus scandens TaxID=2682957 RepID=A0ABR1K4Z0_9AGAR
MQRFKRVFSPKSSKKTDSSRRRSRSFSSVPLNNSENVRNDSKFSSKSSKRERRVKPSDITVVMDISAGNTNGLEEDDSFVADDPVSPRTPPLLIDKDFLDNFPQPPQMHAYSASSARIPIFPTDYGIPADDLLPPLHPKVERFMLEQRAARSSSVSPSRQPLSRSSSNASYCRPTYSAYPSLHSQSPDIRATTTSFSRHPVQNGPKTRPIYHTTHSNYSTRSLGADITLGSLKTSDPPLNHKKSASDFPAYNPPPVLRSRHRGHHHAQPRHRPGPNQAIPENVGEDNVTFPSYQRPCAPCAAPMRSGEYSSQRRL